MYVDCWIQQVTTRVGAVTCWIQQSVSPKQVVGFSCLFNSEVDQLINKFRVRTSDVKFLSIKGFGNLDWFKSFQLNNFFIVPKTTSQDFLKK